MYFVTYTDIVRLGISDLIVLTAINNEVTFILTERNSLTHLGVAARLKWDLFLHVTSIC